MPQPPLYHVSRGTDSYKLTHHEQYPPNTSKVCSYFEARGSPAGWDDEVLFFGLQYFLKRYLAGVVVDHAQIDRSRQLAAAHFGNTTLYNEKGWRQIVEEHGGRLPVSIRAVLEGTLVPTQNVLMTIENTDPACYWLTNWLETLLVQVWSMCTVATNSHACRNLIGKALETSGSPADLNFKLHDFGYRGVTCPEAAATAGAAHLVSFRGTDTFAAIDLLYDYYQAEAMPGFSIPASEHSTITSWGKDGELAAFRNMLDKYPDGLVECVSDSYDIFNACKNYWGGALKDRLLGRDGTLVVRPDSGELPGIVIAVLDTLGAAFGTSRNVKGYRVLPPQIRVIQGDGIDRAAVQLVLDTMLEAGWSADNIAFGSGGGLLQKFDRDTLKFAFKCSSVTVAGQQRDVFKDPVTDHGKKSKRGRLMLVRDAGGRLTTVPQDSRRTDDQLVEVFRDGVLLVDQPLADIRARASSAAGS